MRFNRVGLFHRQLITLLIFLLYGKAMFFYIYCYIQKHQNNFSRHLQRSLKCPLKSGSPCSKDAICEWLRNKKHITMFDFTNCCCFLQTKSSFSKSIKPQKTAKPSSTTTRGIKQLVQISKCSLKECSIVKVY